MWVSASPPLEKDPVLPWSLCERELPWGCGLITWPVASVARAEAPVPGMLPQASGCLLWGRMYPGPGGRQAPPPAVPARCGIDLLSLAFGSLLSEGSLGPAEREAAGLAFLQQFSNIYQLADMPPRPQRLLCSEYLGAGPWLPSLPPRRGCSWLGGRALSFLLASLGTGHMASLAPQPPSTATTALTVAQ